METEVSTLDDESTESSAPAAPAQSPNSRAAGPAGKVRKPGPDRREDRVDRRSGLDRRQKTAAQSGYNGPERRSGEDRRASLERRRGPGRRLSDDRKAAEEGEMTVEQFEFVMAIQTYKKVNKRLYPTWTEILEIIRQLGYRKVLPRDFKLDVPEPELTKMD
ncbi:MAG: hypothetical protein JWL69_3926 [Phycisphaerales bacterium]|jgi:hypothetical protein|nr:hypothetical protein [Phycisphaerales bacterium]MDB5357284.1 hypothetical protein [Phycisphaerales bacterium]